MAENKNIELIRGDPKVAIRKLSVPTTIAMLIVMVYNLTDSIWIAGIGANAIAATGFTAPLYMFIGGVGNAIGSGGNSLIARAIGAKDKELADNAGCHTVLITMILTVIFTIFTVGLLRPMLEIMQAGDAMEYAMTYGTISFSFTVFLLFSSVLAAIFRSEGDVKRAMYVMVGTSVINLILDPVFIYALNLGIAGAAYATALSGAIACAVMAYWIWIKKDTYLSISLKNFKFDMGILKDILNVSLPNLVENFLIALQIFAINSMLTMVAGTMAVGAYTSGKRVNMMANVPLMGIGTSVLTVSGAAFGARSLKKLRETYSYSMKIAHVIAIILASIMFFGAEYISLLFTYSPESIAMRPMLVFTIQALSLFLLAYPAGNISSMMFQSVGKGMISLMITLFRTLIFQVALAYLFGILLGYGMLGVYIGVIGGCGLGSIMAYLLSEHYIQGLKKDSRFDSMA